MMIVFPDTQILYYMYFILYFNVTNESTLKLSSVLVLLLPHNYYFFSSISVAASASLSYITAT